MIFKYPEFLYGLFALAIPIIIHLFNFRRYTTVYFSSVNSLFSIHKESKSKSKLKNLLILIARLILLASLVIAFAFPVIPSMGDENATREKILGIYVDNSFSMQNSNSQGQIVEQAVKLARKIAESFPENQRFLLLTNDFKIKHQKALSQNDFQDALSDLSTSAQNVSLQQVADRFAFLVGSLPNAGKLSKELILISDFQKEGQVLSEVDLKGSKAIVYPIEQEFWSNLSVDSCWFDKPGISPDEISHLHILITNHSQNAIQNLPIRLYLNDSLRSVSNVNLAPQKQLQTSLNYQNIAFPWVKGRIEIDDYTLTFDNQLYFAYENSSQINILNITPVGDNSYLKTLFEVEPFFKYEESVNSNIDYASFGDQEVILLDGLRSMTSGFRDEIINYLSNGGNLIFFPAEEGLSDDMIEFFNSIGMPQFSNTPVPNSKLNRESVVHPLIAETISEIEDRVNLPQVYDYFPWKESDLKPSQRILFDDLKHTLAYVHKIGKGQVLVFNLPVNKNQDLITSPLFMPLMYRFSLSSYGADRLYQLIDEKNVISVSAKDQALDELIVRDSEGSEYVPKYSNLGHSISVNLDNMVQNAGIYSILTKQTLLGEYAWNYSRVESDPEFYSMEELKDELNKVSNENWTLIDTTASDAEDSFSTQIEERSLWYYFLLLALAMLVFELILVNWKE